MTDRETVREVRLEGVELTLHLPLDHGEIHAAIESGLLSSGVVRHVDGYEIAEVYEVEDY